MWPKTVMSAYSAVECGSKKHVTALYPGPPPWTLKAPNTEHECTEVCGGTNSSQSCSNICLIKVHPDKSLASMLFSTIKVIFHLPCLTFSTSSISRAQHFPTLCTCALESQKCLGGMLWTRDLRGTDFQSRSRKILSRAHPLQQKYILSGPAPTRDIHVLSRSARKSRIKVIYIDFFLYIEEIYMKWFCNIS